MAETRVAGCGRKLTLMAASNGRPLSRDVDAWTASNDPHCSSPGSTACCACRRWCGKTVCAQGWLGVVALLVRAPRFLRIAPAIEQKQMSRRTRHAAGGGVLKEGPVYTSLTVAGAALQSRAGDNGRLTMTGAASGPPGIPRNVEDYTLRRCSFALGRTGMAAATRAN
jgi:hypothetical protein